MICELCLPGWEEVADILPDTLTLIYEDKYGHYGLISSSSDNHYLILNVQPFPDPILNDGEGLADDDPLWQESSRWVSEAETFMKLFHSHYVSYGTQFHWELYGAALAAGFDREHDGYFEMWLFDRIGKAIHER